MKEIFPVLLIFAFRPWESDIISYTSCGRPSAFLSFVSVSMKVRFLMCEAQKSTPKLLDKDPQKVRVGINYSQRIQQEYDLK